jgi:hypothetical protein
MCLGCSLPLISIGPIIGGGQAVYTGFKNRKITEVTVDSLSGTKPDAKWLRITDGVLDTINSADPCSFGVGDAKSLYVPLVPKDTDSSESIIHVLVLTTDPALLDSSNKMKDLVKSNADDATAGEFLIENMEKMHVSRPVEGLVQYGFDGDDKKSRKIRALYSNLASGLIIIEEGRKPSQGLGIGMLLGGGVLGGILVMSSSKKKQ